MPVSAPSALPGLQAVLFDLDGTLLEVDMGTFIPAYIDGLARHFTDRVPDGRFARAMQGAIRGLLGAPGGTTGNRELFYGLLEQRLGLPPEELEARLADFCADGLEELAPLVRALPLAREILAGCLARGLQVVIATNPVFPRTVIEARLRWGGLADFPYAHVTVLENSRFCKPRPGYFLDLLGELALAPENCLMVGNDTEHDLAARAVGIPAFLVDTWLVDRAGGDFRADFRGDHHRLQAFLAGLGPAGPAN